eukprot:SAG22_NODE_2805_length_2196_cov_1.859323_2_plen_235_part_00
MMAAAASLAEPGEPWIMCGVQYVYNILICKSCTRTSRKVVCQCLPSAPARAISEMKMVESMEEFDELAKGLVIIDFTATWCDLLLLAAVPVFFSGKALGRLPPLEQLRLIARPQARAPRPLGYPPSPRGFGRPLPPRCGPCKRIGPYFEELAGKHPSVTCAKVDVDEADDVAEKAGVSAMPTFQVRRLHISLMQRTWGRLSIGSAPAAGLPRSLSHSPCCTPCSTAGLEGRGES